MTEWVEKNKAHFNEAASTYNAKFSKTILQIIDKIQARRDWIGVDWIEDSSEDSENSNSSAANPSAGNEGKTVKLLDYACGTGLISRAFAPYVSQCIGVDISESMVNEYNAGATNQGIAEDEMHAVVGDLIAPTPSATLSGAKFEGFDIAAVGMGWHHFENPLLAAHRLADRLKVGGVLFIIDFLPFDDPKSAQAQAHSHGASHHHAHEEGKGKHSENEEISHQAVRFITHFGFSEDEMMKVFESAGVGGGFEYMTLGEGTVFKHSGQDMKRSVFMARGTKL
ncbi:S-adenosyl-L-methionine-dependent methyltransferase [Calycina marina]|uniref:S-adenosyl-L-methionine-dependent methyltransferase n=1 Tax=Calycina marina TaxID=1763456 RepID=A0A9P7Z838_9HELO|nr:S-adenosyl-L-methionine-dependent methyltransferase [Calycina marina]